MAGSKPGAIHLRIVEVMKRFPEGISAGQIRQALGLKPEDQTHLDRRKRDLKKWFVIKTVQSTQVTNGKSRRVTLYKYAGKRKAVTDGGDISIRVRAEVIHAAHGRSMASGDRMLQHVAHAFKLCWSLGPVAVAKAELL